MRLTSTLERSMEKVEDAGGLDRLATPLAGAVRSLASRSRTLTDLLHGVPLGHPAHPAIVLLPVGSFASATILDFVPGTGPAVPVLVTTGLASTVPAAAAGLVDWAELHPQQQRVGLVHATSNVVGATFYGLSLYARGRRRWGAARLYSLAGFSALMVGGYLGGHLSYRQSAGANHAEDVPHLVPGGWNDLCAIDDLPDGRPVEKHIGETSVMVVRRGKAIDVLSDKCSHLSGPLHEGRLSEEDGVACITCPWHGSTFALSDGRVVSGPATVKQHAFDVRVSSGVVQVRLPGASGDA
ncbi:nitrite reductase/ring-hydroxylating ferredoxin subunit [Motilibacter rhizosphaerae]|uniref:Nitrite reductase/ring-hydroxylating ferredoxin subunit n=1 Tax=Motilibacter rhizosphaerae TaxID=598652 RepID=A0A4Q7NAN5_9ACTN|nr:Rieske 2Fe-2S domain-containing protein [Motilibacter rhizosphaerae]RZS80002.1 nitrite reductase/ring-hydroxylating ferredoxin subunit [Motilibacter rhizosphaerae]